ncbi:MAG TPA: hypothetical protein VIL65_18520 [Beijerinckiaceae bacterium]|jgi:hypothetical protein
MTSAIPASFPRFVRAFFAALAVMLAACAGLTLAVDPYGLFGTRLLPSRMFPKTERMSFGADRSLKAIEIARLEKGGALVLGSSRVAVGIDPEEPSLRDLGLYNAGLLNGTMRENVAVADYAVRHAAPKRLIWALDHELYAADMNPQTDYALSPFAGGGVAAAWVRATLSTKALTAAWRVARRIPRRINTDATLRGWSRVTAWGEGRALDWAGAFRSEFRGFAATPPGMGLDADAADAAFEAALRRFVAAGVAVDLAINPRYVWRLEATEQLGRWADYEAWKRRLAAIAARVSRETGRPVRLFDFDVAGPITTEALRPGVSVERPRYFQETSHYRSVVGSVLVNRVLGRPIPPGFEAFGMEITPATIEAHLAEARRAFEAWRRAEPDVVRDVHSLLEEARRSTAAAS